MIQNWLAKQAPCPNSWLLTQIQPREHPDSSAFGLGVIKLAASTRVVFRGSTLSDHDEIQGPTSTRFLKCPLAEAHRRVEQVVVARHLLTLFLSFFVF